MSQLIQFARRCSLAQRLVHQELPFARGEGEHGAQLFERLFMEVFGESQSVTSDFKRADSFLECFFVILADRHYFADCAHLGAQPVFRIFELFERPTRELDYHVVTGRCVLVERAVAPVRNFIQGHPCGKLCGDQSDGKTGCF